MANKLVLVIGIVQIVTGGVLLGLLAKDFHDVNSSKLATTADKVNAFGPVITGILVAFNGIIGVIASCSSKTNLDVFYMMGAAVASTASAAMLWIYAVAVYSMKVCRGSDLEKKFCPTEQYNVRSTVLAFSLIACTFSVIGMVVTGLATCRK